jgi:hypothetical protein
MLKWVICHWVVLASLMVVLTCLASSAEPLKIGVVAPLTGPAAESIFTQSGAIVFVDDAGGTSSSGMTIRGSSDHARPMGSDLGG